MDDALLDRFETLRIHPHQKLSNAEATRNADSREVVAEKMNQWSTLPLESTTGCNMQNVIDTHQGPPVRPLRPTKVTRKQNMAIIAQEVLPSGLQIPPGQRFLSPHQTSNFPHHQPSQDSLSQGKMRTRSQCGQSCSVVPPFVPQRPLSKAVQSEKKLSPQIQRVSLSTKGAAANLALPFRSKRTTDLSPSTSQIFSSPSASSRDRGRGRKRSPKEQEVVHKIKNSDELIHLPAPDPSAAYLAKASLPVSQLPMPQSLLLVLDLNGTLLFRTLKAANYVSRPGIDTFLDYCFANHSVLIWSSARPCNVLGVCKKIFKPAQRRLLLGEWARDTFELTPDQYQQRVQVYKHLNTVWSNSAIQSRHPYFATGGRWGQHNTVLIDDSPLKAAAQPFNLVKVPEFVKTNDPAEGDRGALELVRSKLEELRMWNDVSAFMRAQQVSDGTKGERGLQ